mgnify:CR=1 FL=1
MAAPNSIRLELDRASEARLKRMAAEVPTMFRRAHGRAAEAARKQFSAIMRHGGGYKGVPVPKFARLSDFRSSVKKSEGMSRRIWDGSKKQFASDKAFHVKFVKGDAQFVGFPDNLSEFFSRVLEKDTHMISARLRRAWHIRYPYAVGLKIPMMYERPQRHVIEPFAAHLASGVFASWVSSNFAKMYSKKFGRAFS